MRLLPTDTVSASGWLVLLILLTPVSAFAALGGDLNSVVTDQVHLQGSLQSTQVASFMIHEIRPPTGVVIREYMSLTGTVFAVSWRGPWPPDMQLLLGSYSQQYADAVRTRASSGPGRKPLVIVQPDFIVQQSGHPRSFAGRAYLPQLLPPGVKAEDLQ